MKKNLFSLEKEKNSKEHYLDYHLELKISQAKFPTIIKIRNTLMNYRYRALSELIFLRNIKSMEVYEKLSNDFSLKWKVEMSKISNMELRQNLGKSLGSFCLLTKLFEQMLMTR